MTNPPRVIGPGAARRGHARRVGSRLRRNGVGWAMCLIPMIPLLALDGAGPGAGREPRGDCPAEPDPGAAAPDADAAGPVGQGWRRQSDLSRPSRVPTAFRRQQRSGCAVAVARGLRSRNRCASFADASTRRRTQVQRQGADLAKRIDDMAFQTQNPQGGMPPGPGPAPVRPTPSPSSPGLALLPPPTSLGGPSSGPPPQPPACRRRSAGPAHAGTGDAGGQCRIGPARLSRRPNRQRARC